MELLRNRVVSGATSNQQPAINSTNLDVRGMTPQVWEHLIEAHEAIDFLQRVIWLEKLTFYFEASPFCRKSIQLCQGGNYHVRGLDHACE